MKTVFFGPFIGEFGWELLFWQGWVRRLCRTVYRDHRTVVASYPGRYPFYPDVDEVWELPQWFLDLNVSSHSYYTDGWRNGLPGRQVERVTLKSALPWVIRLRRPVPVWVEERVQPGNIEEAAQRLLDEYRSSLPQDTIFHVPWGPFEDPITGKRFGIELPTTGDLKPELRKHVGVTFDHQIVERLVPTERGEEYFKRHFGDTGPLCAVYPRARSVRRADKNWPKQKYVKLIGTLQRLWPDRTVAVIGAPGGAYFHDGVPDGCLDLVNLPDAARMDIQLAAVQRSAFAVGGLSGAMLVAHAAGCPGVTWGFPHVHARYHRENFMSTPIIFHCEMDPSVDDVVQFLTSLEKMLLGYQQTAAAAGAGGSSPQGSE